MLTRMFVTCFIFLICSIKSFSSAPVYDDTIANIVEKVGSSVVHITSKINVPVYSRHSRGYGNLFEFFFGIPNNVIPKERGIGSGFIYDSSGLIITNNHVVEGSDQIIVTLDDGRSFTAVYKGGAPERDIAILQINDPDFKGRLADKFVVPLGNSSKLRVGEWVIAIGSPFHLDRSVTVGIVSAKGRNLGIEGNTSYSNLIQTDASINPGNSGGPLLNLQGQVIGINTAINPMGQGLGFAIPVNLAKRITHDLAKYGRVKKSWLGVYIDEITEQSAKKLGLKSIHGVYIRRVVHGTPAQKAGLRKGDVIIRVNGTITESPEILIEKIQEIPIGEIADVQVLRNGSLKYISVMLTEKGKPKQYESRRRSSSGNIQSKAIGLKVRELQEEDKQYLGLSKVSQGVIVTEVQRGSLAARSGVKPGDVIIQINQKRIASIEHFNQFKNQFSHDQELLLVIIRDGYLSYIEIAL